MAGKTVPEVKMRTRKMKTAARKVRSEIMRTKVQKTEVLAALTAEQWKKALAAELKKEKAEILTAARKSSRRRQFLWMKSGRNW